MDGLSVRFGGLRALDEVSLRVGPVEVCGIVGPNGAGKTTLFDCLSRLRRPHAGSIRFDGEDLLDRRPHELAGLGVARTFQQTALVEGLSVRENVMLGAHRGRRTSFMAAAARLPAARRHESGLRAAADHWLEALGLAEVADDAPDALSHGTARRVELARALCQEPRLLMLDEPAAGLSRAEVERLVDTVRAVRARAAAAVLLVDHHVEMVMRVADRVVALHLGRVIAAGTPDEVRRHPAVIEAYLGTDP